MGLIDSLIKWLLEDSKDKDDRTDEDKALDIIERAEKELDSYAVYTGANLYRLYGDKSLRYEIGKIASRDYHVSRDTHDRAVVLDDAYRSLEAGIDIEYSDLR